MAKIVSLNSFRRGTGKTSIAVNLAVLLAQQNLRVALFDGDFQLPGLHLWFGLEDSEILHTFNGYLRGDYAISEVALPVTSRLGRPLDGEIFLAPASTRFADIQKLLRTRFPVARFQDGLCDLDEALNLDFLLIDTSAGLSEDTLCAIAASEILLIMLRPDQQEYQGTAVLVDVARQLEIPSLGMVMNQVPDGLSPESVLQQLKETYESDFSLLLPQSAAMQPGASRSILALTSPADPYTQALSLLVDKLKE